MMLLKISMLCLFLTGCACAPVPKPPKIDSYLMSECATLTNVKEFLVFDHVLTQKAKDNLVLAECIRKHNGLVDSVKKYEVEFNATK